MFEAKKTMSFIAEPVDMRYGGFVIKICPNKDPRELGPKQLANGSLELSRSLGVPIGPWKIAGFKNMHMDKSVDPDLEGRIKEIAKIQIRFGIYGS